MAMILWLELVASLLVISVAGFELSRCGDALAEKTGMSRSSIGLALLATVTSLPELATGVSSVTIAAVPDIAVGDVLGSCVFNFLLLVVLDFLYREESVYRRAHQGHLMNAAFGTAFIGFAGFNLILYREAAAPALAHVGLYAPILVLLYVLAARTLFRYEREHERPGAQERTYASMSIRQVSTRFALAALVVVATGIWLPFVGEALAARMGWTESFVGTLLVAAATSAPEVVVTIAAVRLGAVDLAIANLLGSNLFNITILAVDDLFYTSGPLLADVSGAHAATAFSAMMMGGLVMVGLVLRPESRVFRTVSWVSLFLMAVYLLNALFAYLYLAGR
jgi:cation:H+ antiporter